MQADPGVPRRTFIYRVLAGITSVITLMLAVPIVGYVLAPLFSPRPHRGLTPVGPLARFPLHQPTLAVIAVSIPGEAAYEQGVYVTNWGANAFTIFKLNCTHLGCPYQWNDEARAYFCPCHGGVFDSRGNVTGGPPPRPLDRYEPVVRGGVLYAGELLLGGKQPV